MKIALILVAAAYLGSLAAVAAAPEGQSQPSQSQPAAPKAAEPEHITVQHILIGFQGSVGGKNITRTKDEAKTLAYEILERAKKGENFDELVKKYTDDSAPGIYSMANNGVATKPGEFPRSRMVAAFGDTGFPLKVGEIGIADHDPRKSPFGWHIVKRIQ